MAMTGIMQIPHERMMQHVRSHPYPLMFASLSGAHLYGFPSPDSDFDLRGAHMLPLETVVGLDPGHETIEKEGVYDGLEIDLVTHDIYKFFSLVLRRNGYVLEQIFSPLVIFAGADHDELKAIATTCITKHHSHHYLGFAATQWKLFSKETVPQVKPLLYVFRVLLTGIHLMRTGVVEANLVTLNEGARLSYVDDLITLKLNGPEKGTLATDDLGFYESEYKRLTSELEKAHKETRLPEMPSGRAAVNDLLVRLRLSGNDGG